MSVNGTARAVILTVATLGLADAAVGQEAAEPAPLPAISVETTKAKKKPVKAAKAKPAPKAAAPSAAPAQPVEAVEPVLAPAAASAPAAVTVSGPPTPGVARTDITAQDIARKNPADLQDLFSGEPGIQVGSSLPMSQKVYVHGIEETNLAVSIDGSLQNNKVFHHNGTTLIDPSLLKAVRVDAGVAPADAGFGALAGSIAYETKDVRDLMDRDGLGGFSTSRFNTNGDVFTQSLAAYGMHSGFEVLGYFTLGDGDEFEDGAGRRVDGTETHFYSGLGKIAYQGLSGDRFEVSHEAFEDDAVRPFRPNAGFIDTGRPWEPRVRDFLMQRRNTVFNYSDATPTAMWDPKVVIAYGSTEVTTPIYYHPRFGVPPHDGIGETDRWNAKVENKFSFRHGTLVTGVDYNQDRALIDLSSVSRPAFDESTDERSRRAGTYAQARIEPLIGSRLSFGGRGDYQWFEGTGGQKFDDGGLSGNISGEQDIVGSLLTPRPDTLTCGPVFRLPKTS